MTESEFRRLYFETALGGATCGGLARNAAAALRSEGRR